MKNLKITILMVVFIFISCQSDDSNQIEEEIFNFEEILMFDSNFLEGASMGMTSSVTENSLYISSRNEYPLVVGENREQIIKLDLDNNNIIEKQYSNSDFITKRLFIENNKLISIGGQFVNTYELDITNDPSTENHQRILSYFTIANGNNTNYIIGGDFLDNNNSVKIYEWNSNNQQEFIEFATLPEPKNGADGVIVNDNLYVFGGCSSISPLGEPSDKIYIIPLSSPNSIQELSMGVAICQTFVHKYNNKIIICGESVDGNSIVGIFDTESDQFEIIEHNLNEINVNYKIGQMTILNNKLYLVYGFLESLNPPGTGIESRWSILRAELN